MSVGVSPDLPHLDDLPPHNELLLRLAKPLITFGLSRYWRISVHGTEHLPADGPVILAANHLGFLDGPVLVGRTRRLSFVLAKAELFRGALGRFLEGIGQVPVDRFGVDKRAVSRSIQVLRAGHALVVFPEGIRGTGEVAFAKGGAAYLAMVTGATIVPVAILGTRDPGQLASQLPHRRARIAVVYGEPIPVQSSGWPRRQQSVAELTEQVRSTLAAHVVAAQARTGLPLPGPPKAKPRRTSPSSPA